MYLVIKMWEYIIVGVVILIVLLAVLKAGKKDVHLDETGVVAHNGGDNIKKVKFSTKNKVNEKEFRSEVLTSKELVLVDFYADWCGPCRMLGPILDTLEDYKVYKINVDEEPTLAQEYGVMSIPCVVFIKDGKETNRFVGLHSKSEILDMLK